MLRLRARRFAVAGLSLAACVLSAWGVLAVFAPGLVARRASALLGTSVTVAQASVGVFPPRLTLAGLRVANPPGFSALPLLAVERLSVRVEAATLLADTLRVPEVTIDGFEMRVQRSGGRTNVEALRDRVRGAMASSAQSTRRIVIGRLRVRGGRVSAPAFLGRRISAPVRDFELKDVGKEKGGILPGQLADLVLRLMDPSLSHAVHNVDFGAAAKGLLPGN
jgi:hypothetical protein